MCDFKIPRLRLGGQRSTFVDKQHVEIGPQKSSVSFTQNFFFNLIAAETLLIPMNIVSFEKAMYQDDFLTVEFRTNLSLCNQSKKG